MFGKRIAELTKDDLGRLVREQWPEDAALEFKESLPAKNGRRDSWRKEDAVDDYARNEIVRQVVGFANAHGGTLLIGIAETDTKPPRAKKIVPLPRAGELAERLRMQCRDMIEPQIDLLEAFAIPTSSKGAGVIAIHAPASRLAPHRHKANNGCYVRRGNRTEAMTMREIQDLTLQIERGLARIEHQFDERRVASDDDFKRFVLGRGKIGYQIRVTAIPLGPLFIERVHNTEAVTPLHDQFEVRLNGQPFKVMVPFGPISWRPILRGSRCHEENEDDVLTEEIHCDGLIEYRLIRAKPSPKGAETRSQLYVRWVIAVVANCLVALEKCRRTAGVPEMEFGLEVEIRTNMPALEIQGYVREIGRVGPFPVGKTIFPRYSIGAPDTFEAAIALIEKDFWNAAGVDVAHKLEIEIPQLS